MAYLLLIIARSQYIPSPKVTPSTRRDPTQPKNQKKVILDSETDTATETNDQSDSDEFEYDMCNNVTVLPVEQADHLSDTEEDEENSENTDNNRKKLTVTKLIKMKKSKKDKGKSANRDIYEEQKRRKALIDVRLVLLGGSYHCRKEQCNFSCQKRDMFSALGHANLDDCLQKKAKKARKVSVECLELNGNEERCGEVFSSKVHLRQHYIKVHQEVFHMCHKCPSKFSTRISLMKHMVKTHENIVEKVTCEKCSKVCMGDGMLRKHIKAVHSSAETEFSLEDKFLQLREKEDSTRENWSDLLELASKTPDVSSGWLLLS